MAKPSRDDNLWLVGAGVALIVAFFSRWTELASGYDLVDQTLFGFRGYLFWLIPATGLALILSAAFTPRLTSVTGLAAGVIPLGLLIYMFGWMFFLFASWGYWLLVAAAVGALVLAATKVSPRWQTLPGIVIVGAFFLPWTRTPWLPCRGVRIPSGTTGIELSLHNPFDMWVTPIMWLAFILGGTLALTAWARPQKATNVAVAAGVCVLLPLLYYPIAGLLQHAEIGVHITMSAAVFSLAYSRYLARAGRRLA